MYLIFCIDDRDGLSFCGRRLSQDREVTARILRMTEGKTLWVHPYSAKLFPADSILADPDYLTKACSGDYCFVEKGPFPSAWEKAEFVILYHWNRAYPSTEKFPREILKAMHLDETEEFPGYSHETITMERFVK